MEQGSRNSVTLRALCEIKSLYDHWLHGHSGVQPDLTFACVRAAGRAHFCLHFPTLSPHTHSCSFPMPLRSLLMRACFFFDLTASITQFHTLPAACLPVCIYKKGGGDGKSNREQEKLMRSCWIISLWNVRTMLLLFS